METKSESSSSEELLRAFVQARSQEAFARLVERHGGMVYASALRQLGERHWAEDATQVVFLLLAQKASGLPQRVTLAGWLFTTTRFVCANLQKQERRRKRLGERIFEMKTTRGDARGGATGGEDALMMGMEPAGLLDDALGRLSKEELAIVLLRFAEEKTFPEAAGALGISENAAKKRAARALEKLKGFLRGTGKAGKGDTFAGALPLILTQQLACKAPGALTQAICHSAALAQGGAVVSHLVIHQLTQGVARSMFYAKVKVAAVAALVVGTVLAGAGVAVHSLDRRAAAQGAGPAAVEVAPNTTPVEAPAAPVVTEAPPATTVAAPVENVPVVSHAHVEVVAFFDAVKNDNVDAVRAYLAQKKECVQFHAEPRGETPLHRARSAAMAKLLVENGADPAEPDDDTNSPAVRWAANYVRTDVVQYLLDKSPKQDDVVFLAATGDLKRLKEKLAEQPELLDFRVRKGDCFYADGTLLHVAARAGQTEMCAYLLDKGMDVDVRGGWNDDNALEGAAYNGFSETVKLLLDRGADPTITDSEFHHGTLWYAALTGRRETVKVMLDHHVKVPPGLAETVERGMKSPWPGRDLPPAEDYMAVVGMLKETAATQK